MSPPTDPSTGRRAVDPAMYSVEFKPKASGRRFVGFLVFLSVLGTAYVGWLTYQDRSQVMYGIAATTGLFTVVLWAAWATSPVSHLHVHGGVLEVRRAGRTERFDLTSHYTQLRVSGSPRSSKWKVLIERPANTPFVIDRTMVDPRAFTRVLEAYHQVG